MQLLCRYKASSGQELITLYTLHGHIFPLLGSLTWGVYITLRGHIIPLLGVYTLRAHIIPLLGVYLCRVVQLP